MSTNKKMMAFARGGSKKAPHIDDKNANPGRMMSSGSMMPSAMPPSMRPGGKLRLDNA